jgi:hypothetical protein
MNFVQFEEALGLDGGNTRSSKLRLGCTEEDVRELAPMMALSGVAPSRPPADRG